MKNGTLTIVKRHKRRVDIEVQGLGDFSINAHGLVITRSKPRELDGRNWYSYLDEKAQDYFTTKHPQLALRLKITQDCRGYIFK